MALMVQFKNNLITNVQDKIIFINHSKSQIVELPEANDQSANVIKDVTNINRKIITSMCYSKSGELFGITTNTKQLVIYNENFNVINNITLKRVASKIRFTATNDLVVADKTGDVFLYKLKDNNLEPHLLLGHLSMLLDVLVSPCSKYIITCDRDEKIRVSCFPNAYNIVTYCLGHKEFVTNIEIINENLISASGDGTLRLWNYITGQQIDCIDTNEYLEDLKLKNEFCQQMDTDNIEINALPITNIEVAHVENRVFVITSILNYNGLLVFEVLDSKLQFIQTISLNSALISYSHSTILVVLTQQGFINYQLQNSLFVVKHLPYLDEVYKEYKNLFEMSCNNNKDIMVLYKRKFDNVQEYLERKKQRLEVG